MRVTGHLVSRVHESKKPEEGRKCKRQSTLPLSLSRRILSLIGALPCSGKSPYWPSLDRKKSNVLYCAVFLSFTTTDIVWTLIQKKIEYDQTDPSRFLHRVITLFTIITLFVHVMVLLIWSDVPEHNRFMELFATIQVTFQRATGKRLVNRQVALEYLLTLSTLVTLPCFYCMSCYLITDLDRSFSVTFAIIYSNTIGLLLVVYWIIAARTIIDALDDVQSEFKQFLQSDKLTACIVFEFRMMWLYMRKVCDTMSKWQALFFGYTVSLSVCIIFSYQALTFLQEAKIAVAFGLLATGCFHSVLIVFICRASHETQEKMKILVKEVLPNISLSSYDRETQREILMLFLIESARPAVTTFYGLLTVNRPLLLSFVSNVVTYIIVLVQLNQKECKIAI